MLFALFSLQNDDVSAGLGPETVDFQLGALAKGVGWNILRPEALESICMLHRITNDTIYRDWGWQIFQAFEKYSKVSPLALQLSSTCAIAAAGSQTLLVTHRQWDPGSRCQMFHPIAVSAALDPQAI